MQTPERNTSDLDRLNANTFGIEPTFMPLSAFEPELANNRDALAYWRGLPRGSENAPHKDYCDVLELAEFLPRCVILEMLGPTIWPIIMFGTELVANFGIDATGMNAHDFYGEEEKPRVAARMATMKDRGILMCSASRVKSMGGVTADTEWLFLPLSNDDGSITRVLVSTSVYEAQPSLRNFEMAGTLKDRQIFKLIFAEYDD